MQTLNAPPSSQYIQNMFDGLARKYDIFNRLTSAGMDCCWRKKALERIQPGMRVLDLGCGTGDLALAAAKLTGATGRVIGLDFSKNMIELAERRFLRLDRKNLAPIQFVQKKAEELPISSDLLDSVVSGFVLRNIYQNIDPILDGIRESLKENGEISLLDITEPKNPIIRATWHFYMATFVRLYGLLLFGKKYPSAYLVESANRFLKSDEFVQKLKTHHFREVHAETFLFGIITLYRAKR